MQEKKSEVARLREQIELEYLAAKQGLTGLSYGGSMHQFITARLDQMGECHEKLVALVGPQEAIEILANTLEKL